MAVCNIRKWLKDNQKYMGPPVCNRMMHNGQMVTMFVGGPNQRNDYHIECGEELFLQLKGAMCVKVVEQGKHRDVHIKEGEMFLLPARVPHSPQRYENTIGLVLERGRDKKTELDGLRFYTEKDGKKTTEELYEAWFYCTDLSVELAPAIEKFFASEQCKTGRPVPGSILDKKPVEIDTQVQLMKPFSFQEWIDSHRQEINEKGRKQIFPKSHQYQVFVFGEGENTEESENAETFIWQWEGESTVQWTDSDEFRLRKDDSLLIPVGKRFTVRQEKGGIALVAYQDPAKAKIKA